MGAQRGLGERSMLLDQPAGCPVVSNLGKLFNQTRPKTSTVSLCSSDMYHLPMPVMCTVLLGDLVVCFLQEMTLHLILLVIVLMDPLGIGSTQ